MKAPTKSKVREIFENELHGPVAKWRKDAWNSSTDLIESSKYWLYKTEECKRWWVDLKAEIARANQGEVASASAKRLMGAVAGNLANCYRGIWVAEVYESGQRTWNLSHTMTRIIERALDELERLYEAQGRSHKVSPELKKQLDKICDDMIGIYEKRIDSSSRIQA